MVRLAIIAFILLIFQGVLSYLQVSDYRKRVAMLKTLGIVAVGAHKGILGSGNITILACSREGLIVRGERLEGITVFERFREIKEIKGMPLEALKDQYRAIEGKKSKDGKRNAMLQAVESLEKKLTG